MWQNCEGVDTLSEYVLGFYFNTAYIVGCSVLELRIFYHKKKFNTKNAILIMGMIVLKRVEILIIVMEFTNASGFT